MIIIKKIMGIYEYDIQCCIFQVIFQIVYNGNLVS